MKTISRYLMTLVALFAISTGAWAEESTYYVVGNFTNWETSDANKMTWDDTAKEYTLTLDVPAGAMFKVVGIYNQTQNWYPDGGGNAYGENGELLGAGKYTVHFDPKGGVEGWFAGYFKVDIVPGSVIINDNQTEATLEMPADDVTVNYELVRDMSVQMQAQVGDDAAKEPRYRVQRNGESWVPADMNPEQVMALFSVNDLIEKKTLAPISYLVSIYAIDDEGKPTGNAMDFQTFTFAPGRYAVTATAPQGIAYEGTTALSNIFELFQGYEITVGAGEYATFYKDEIIYTEDEDAELYTISSVSDTEAVLSDKLAMVAANTPMLVYNKGTEAKTFILLPSLKEDANEVTVAREFRGTLAEKEMPASSTTVDYYVCTGKEFMWVRDAGVIAANKCWLQIGDQPAAARAMTRSIVGGGNTTNMDDVRWQMEDGNYYDLQGRKVEKPTRGGIYIHNGRKVVKK